MDNQVSYQKDGNGGQQKVIHFMLFEILFCNPNCNLNDPGVTFAIKKR